MGQSFRTPLGKARGLGSAKEGVQHWWVQRVTAVALIPLVVLFVSFVIMLANEPYGTVSAFLGKPFVAAVTILLVVALFWHLRLGLQVVIEDYVHTEWTKLISLLAMTFATIIVGLACVFAVLSMAIVGG
jgi:succinate dehydrogenase / fumarate reductase membrane anchor subunit